MLISIFQGIVLGIIQGATEFLPVSSTAHLILVPKFLGWSDPGMAFDTTMHLGTLVAVIWAFRVFIRDLLRDAFLRKSVPARLLLAQIALAGLPALAVGALLGDWIESHFRAPVWIAFQLAFWGAVLWFVDRRPLRESDRTHRVEDVGWPRALLMGVSQAIALFPGVSRSGITMTTGLWKGLDRETAVRFSFLLSIPVVAAAGASGVVRAATDGFGSASPSMIVAGLLASFVSGLLAIRLLRSYVATHSFTAFVVYRFALAAIVLLALV